MTAPDTTMPMPTTGSRSFSIRGWFADRKARRRQEAEECLQRLMNREGHWVEAAIVAEMLTDEGVTEGRYQKLRGALHVASFLGGWFISDSVMIFPWWVTCAQAAALVGLIFAVHLTAWHWRLEQVRISGYIRKQMLGDKPREVWGVKDDTGQWIFTLRNKIE